MAQCLKIHNVNKLKTKKSHDINNVRKKSIKSNTHFHKWNLNRLGKRKLQLDKQYPQVTANIIFNSENFKTFSLRSEIKQVYPPITVFIIVMGIFNNVINKKKK